MESPVATPMSFEFERGAVPISSIQIPKEDFKFGHLHVFLAEYKDMLKFTPVEEWTLLVRMSFEPLSIHSHLLQSGLPKVSRLMHARRHRLWKDHTAIRNSENTRLDVLYPAPKSREKMALKFLDPGLAEILNSRLELILAVTYGMSLEMLLSDQRAVCELEWRHQWDSIKYRCYTTAEELVSTQVL